jgi:hypothetical protein
MDTRCYVRNPPLDGLAICQLDTEGLTPLGMLAQHIESTAGHPDRSRPHFQAARLQTKLHGRVALPDLAKDRIRRNATIVEDNLVRLSTANHGYFALDDKSRTTLINYE